MTPSPTPAELVCYALSRAVGMVEPDMAQQFKALRQRIESGEVYVFDADDVEMLKVFQRAIHKEAE